jgi:predicted nucleic acid-binding protein
MNRCFADTSYFLALVNPQDVAHKAAVEQTKIYGHAIVTTSAILGELGNHLSHSNNRALFLETVQRLRAAQTAQILHVDERLFDAGIALFSSRSDKDWSLTDCISFVVMEEQAISEALSTDHHFEQAGFTLLLGNA